MFYLELACGVPQGLIVGPLFSIYLLPMKELVCRDNVDFHFYVDDTHLCVSDQIQLLDNFINYHKIWVAKIFNKIKALVKVQCPYYMV